MSDNGKLRRAWGELLSDVDVEAFSKAVDAMSDLPDALENFCDALVETVNALSEFVLCLERTERID